MVEVNVQEVVTAITAENQATSAENVQIQDRKEKEDQLLAIIANKKATLPVIVTNQEKKEKVIKKESATNGKMETVLMVTHADLLMKEKVELNLMKEVVTQEEEIAVDTVMTEEETEEETEEAED
jgi:cellobiose-specific phosphotransferase system component IIA